MTTKHSTGNSTNNRTKRSSYLFLPPRDASSQDKASGAAEAAGSKNLSGFTLVELMVAMCVSLMLLGGVVSLFGTLGESVNDSKSNSEMLQMMRHASRQLQSDLGNVSLVPDPAQTQTNPQGFFEYVEGPFNDSQAFSTDPVVPECTDPVILDDGGSSFTALTGPKNNQWFRPFTNGTAKNKSYGNTVHERDSKYLSYAGQFEKTGLQNGKYKVSLTWPIDWKYGGGYEDKTESDVPVTLSSGADTQNSSVNQSQAPSDFSDPEGNVNGEGDLIMWQDIGEVQVTNGEIIVQIGPCGNANGWTTGNKKVFADAIRIECLELDPVSAGGNGGASATLPLVGDCDDVLHFTTKTDEGAHEVVWFLTPMKGHENKSVTDKRYRLHRRELTIAPQAPTTTESLSLGYQEPMPADWAGGYDDFENWQDTAAVRTPNTLEALARRYNRNAHVPKEWRSAAQAGEFVVNKREDYQFSLETEFIDDAENDRTGNTVILENVIGFDVQAYDPTAPIYSTTASNGQTIALLPTDRGWTAKHQNAVQAAADQGLDSIFDLSPPPTDVGPIGKGAFRDLDPTQSDDTHSPLQTLNTANGFVATYDSWSGDYVKTFDHDGNSGTEKVPGDVGFDNDGNGGIVDTAEDLRESPPYDAPLRAVQVEIRMQEPESGKVRSVKVRKFLGKR